MPQTSTALKSDSLFRACSTHSSFHDFRVRHSCDLCAMVSSLACRQVLSLRSEVFCSLLLSSDLSEHGKQTEVPLEDCSLAEANIFLRYIYSREPVTDEFQAEGLTKVSCSF